MMTDDTPNTAPTPAEQAQKLFVRHERAIRALGLALQPSLADAEGKGNCRSTPERILSRRPVASLGEGGERSVKRDREEQIKLPPC